MSAAAGPTPAAAAVEAELYNPADHTVAEVVDYAAAHPDDVGRLYDAEAAGKARSTLLTALEGMGAV